jgi:hypothetical protein
MSNHPAGDFAAKLVEGASLAHKLQEEGRDIQIKLFSCGFSITDKPRKLARFVTFEDIALREGNALVIQLQHMATDKGTPTPGGRDGSTPQA